MPRVYSKTGCIRCKQRKKKCDEARPVCAACAAWGWTCIYSTDQRYDRLARSQALTLHCPQRSIALPRCCDDANEANLLREIPQKIRAFYSPTSGNRIKDLQAMWQLAMNNYLLRHAVIACFTNISNLNAEMDELHIETYGKALHTLRGYIINDHLDRERMICAVASVMFLGKMESFSPRPSVDPLRHWIGLLQMLGSKDYRQLQARGQIPYSENMLIYESLLFHLSTQGTFSNLVETAWRLWHTNWITCPVRALNPGVPDRSLRSPLLYGQYRLYKTALEVTYLLQRHHFEAPASARLATIRARILDRQAELRSEPSLGELNKTPSIHEDTERAVYRMFCEALLICTNILEPPSTSRKIEVQRLLHLGTAMFRNLPIFHEVPELIMHAGHFMLAAIWPIQVLACALPDIEQFRAFEERFAKLGQSLDPGHRARAEILLQRVSDSLHGSCDGETDGQQDDWNDLPPGLKLLRKPICVM